MTTRKRPIEPRWTPLEERDGLIPRRASRQRDAQSGKQAVLRPHYETPVPVHQESRPVQRLSHAATTQALPAVPLTHPKQAASIERRARSGGSGRAVMAIGIGMFCMSILYFIAVSWVLPLLTEAHDRLDYGASQVNRFYCACSQGDSPGKLTEVLASSESGHIQVVAIPNGIESKARIFESPYIGGSGVVLVDETDLNGDGRVDLVCHLRNSSIAFVLWSTSKGFSLSHP